MKPQVKRILEKLSTEKIQLAKYDTKNLQSEADDIKSDLQEANQELTSVFDELSGAEIGFDKAYNDAEGIVAKARKMAKQIEDAQDTLREMELDPSQLDKKLLEIANVIATCDTVIDDANKGMAATTKAQSAIRGR